MYIASADFMTRNTQRRVEVGCPILDRDVKKKIGNIIQLLWTDDQKAMKLLPTGNYIPIRKELHLNSQEAQMDLAKRDAEKEALEEVAGTKPLKKSFMQRLKEWVQ